MNIQELVHRLASDGLSLQAIAVLLGIKALQVSMYSDGRTRSAGAKVALAIFRHITIEGVPLVIEPYRGRQDVLDKVKLYEEQCAQIVRDSGYGQYNIISSST